MDEDSSKRAVARGLRQNGIEVLTAIEAGRQGASDEEQLEFAATQGRVLFSANVADFARIHKAWLQAGRHHSGLVLLHRQRTPIGIQVRALTRLANALVPGAMRDRQEYLSGWQD